MKVLKSAKQKNVVLASEFYTEYEVCEMMDNHKVFFITSNGISYDSVAYMVTDTEVRIFTELINRLEVEYSKELECYMTVAILNDGSKLYVII